MGAGGQEERPASAEISLSGRRTLTRLFLCVFPQTTDDIVSSAECSSDDEDLEECDSGHTGGISVSSCACTENLVYFSSSLFDLLPRSFFS